MKKILFWIGVLLVTVACSTQKNAIENKNITVEVATEDSLEYELETFDLKFETWYLLHDSPSQYRSQAYYEGWNRQYVSAWNANGMDPPKSSFFETIVGYDPSVDYGFELNHKLFYYFQYVEKVLKIQIMEGGPHAVPF
jgi:hypothetical protein